MTPTGRGLIIAAPSSGSGKTTVTLGLLRALHLRGTSVRGAKSGPDYIDTRFLEAACRAACVNLDAWAMTPARLRRLVAGPGELIVEGAMGLFDGAPPDGKGSVAHLAKTLGLPVVLVVDASRMAGSVAPLVAGFAGFDPKVPVVGVILNKVGSPRHEVMLRRALSQIGMPVLGSVPRTPGVSTPSRHLGLVQAQERQDLENFLDEAGDLIARSVDIDALLALGGTLPGVTADPSTPPDANKTLAVAQDAAFDFAYRHQLNDLEASGWHIVPFSPLRNEPVPKCDRVFLPGGYPELHAATLANNSNFMDSLRKTAETTEIYGECGGYMVLGDRLTDADGTAHKMAGLLPLETSFAERKLHLGYRTLHSEIAPVRGSFKAHEFHYATTIRADGPSLFTASDSENTRLPDMGLVRGKVCGSFAHIIEAVDTSAQSN
ncbi:cobyrinic acid a,c-diamide synthase [Litoreibacter ponti]|uniref:Hydrogenobyrinate a,c-diamide synthase n=1 Tax=Litoreibacter ponti TaxID=1510457 RepID=A0A2T6BJ48_9RHOB|nr:cobyrinate a,c-diamide synthase [Litoreibacter ponti]PTX56076.1 cobyrinic acid a,c-diamide synthase [Litoreibacter ponti]